MTSLAGIRRGIDRGVEQQPPGTLGGCGRRSCCRPQAIPTGGLGAPASPTDYGAPREVFRPGYTCAAQPIYSCLVLSRSTAFAVLGRVSKRDAERAGAVVK